MSRGLIALIVLIVLFGGGWLFMQSEPDSTELPGRTSDTDMGLDEAPLPDLPITTDTASAPATAVPTPSASANVATPASNAVTYKDGAFSPATLRVPAGTTVTFKNEGTSVMWVASDPHPTHTLYQGFDAKKEYGNGESFSFTFTRKGTWTYHNHPNASQKGTVIIE